MKIRARRSGILLPMVSRGYFNTEPAFCQQQNTHRLIAVRSLWFSAESPICTHKPIFIEVDLLNLVR